MTQLVLREDSNGIATLTLNRPAQRNALSPEVFAELHAHLESIAAATETIGLVLLRATGPGFCAGADLKANWSDGKREIARQTIALMESIPQPIVACVHAYCYTGGVELILGCDFIVASDAATFADTHSKWGMVASWGQTQRLPRQVGTMKSKEMIFTAKNYSAMEAKEMGLIQTVFPAAEFEAKVSEIAAGIVANSWHSLRGHKKLINHGRDFTYGESLVYARHNNPGSAADRGERIRAGGFMRKA